MPHGIRSVDPRPQTGIDHSCLVFFVLQDELWPNSIRNFCAQRSNTIPITRMVPATHLGEVSVLKRSASGDQIAGRFPRCRSNPERGAQLLPIYVFISFSS